MGLKWILNSAFTQVLGLTEKLQQNQKEAGGEGIKNVEQVKEGRDCFYGGGLNFESGFQMPLHYPRYTKRDYEEMEEGCGHPGHIIGHGTGWGCGCGSINCQGYGCGRCRLG
ncbi:hypothetical protein IC582_014722 [Cucumis melo]